MKSSILMELSLISHPFWGTPIEGIEPTGIPHRTKWKIHPNKKYLQVDPTRIGLALQ
jgi:hypothetical protein